jgi:phage tail sheath protein FI
MAIQLSPGVNVTEIDLTTIVPSVSSTTGAIAGYFIWGPAQKIIVVPDEATLVKVFTGGQGPDSNCAVPFFTAASFLAYGNDLRVVRTVGSNANNAIANSLAVPVQIVNEDVFQALGYITSGDGNTYGSFMARYPGVLGNSIQVDVYDSANANNFANATFTSGATTRYWSSVVTSQPGTSAYVSSQGGANDEFHIVVSDSGGLFTGIKGTILETYPFTSKASDASVNGSSNYWKQSIFNNSKYIHAVDSVDYSNTHTTWGKPAYQTTYARIGNTTLGNTTISLSLGNDDTGTDAPLETGWGLFANKETTDISLVLTAAEDVTVQQYVIDNIVNNRLDCVAFLSPPQSSVVNQAGNESANILTWLGQLARSTSYAVVDSGWKYMYDKYNQTYRWIPLNGDIAGLCVYTDQVRDPWFSPAGFNRGQIKNAVKLAWNPSKTYRDILYSNGVNPVVTFPGNGTVLFGDKTLQAKPSAFDRINVRRLFIVLEKAIAKAAQYSLFELNDTFTRAQFVALVTPFLRDVQGRRGITDFKVVCDTTNNTGFVIDNNQFVGDIYIKPARSINFIQLNFVAVATGVDFSTVVGKF